MMIDSAKKRTVVQLGIIKCRLYAVLKLYESQREKKYLLTCSLNKDSNQPAHPRSLSESSCPHEETLHPWQSKMRPAHQAKSWNVVCINICITMSLLISS